MECDDEETDLSNFLEAMDRALAVHEAGHAVVARALDSDVLFVEIDLRTGNGEVRCSEFADEIKNLAVCLAGCRAEHAFKAPALRSTKKGDFRQMRKLLSCFPESERRAARAEGYRLADVVLKANADVVRRIADELLARRWSADSAVVRIEGDELKAMLSRRETS
jgi:hypothetical protein